jgi:hypothetical protein
MARRYTDRKPTCQVCRKNLLKVNILDDYALRYTKTDDIPTLHGN